MILTVAQQFRLGLIAKAVFRTISRCDLPVVTFLILAAGEPLNMQGGFDFGVIPVFRRHKDQIRDAALEMEFEFVITGVTWRKIHIPLNVVPVYLPADTGSGSKIPGA